MAQVTVEQLAETVGASVDRLLSQMKDAGLPHAAADEAVSEEDKQTLLAHLKQSHGEREGAPRKITLKRKSVSTLRAGGAGKRTVNVEVRIPLSRWNLNLKSTWRVLQTLQRLLRRQS
jgi:translation initiation factor IF-2